MPSLLRASLGSVVALAIAFAWVGAPKAAPRDEKRPTPAGATCTIAGRPLVDMSQHIVTRLAALQATKILEEAAASDPAKAAAIEASRKAMMAKGWKHVGATGFVIKAKSPSQAKSTLARAFGFFFPTLQAQTYSTADPVNGTVIFDSWSDGDDATWEGSAYLENYDSHQWMFSDNQLLTDVETEPQLVDLTPRGSSNRADFRRTREGNLEPVRIKQGLDAPTVCNCPGQGGGPGQQGKPAKSDMECFTRVGLNRAATACGSGFIGCRRAGAAYWSCVGLVCGGAAASQTLAEFYRWTRDCWPS
jgi:hypothetical protein